MALIMTEQLIIPTEGEMTKNSHSSISILPGIDGRVLK
jgi:hypothetical protein